MLLPSPRRSAPLVLLVTALARPAGGPEAMARQPGQPAPSPPAEAAAAPAVAGASRTGDPRSSATPATDAGGEDGDDAEVAERAPASATGTAIALPDAACLSRTLCRIKAKIRWKTGPWTPATCDRVAAGLLASSRKHDLHPALLLAVAINESDLKEKAVRETARDGRIIAKDSGLMGVRCFLDRRGEKCVNGPARGLTLKDLMDPVRNIEIGATHLAEWRDGDGAVERKVVKRRDEGGRLRPVQKNVPCRHKTHAWWAHYNHGPHYIDTGAARHYPHRIAVLYRAVARAMNVPTPELDHTVLTVQDRGQRARTADRPVEFRYKKLVEQINEAGGTCGPVASSP